MANRNRRAGVINIQANGVVYDAVGNFSWNLGFNKRDGMVGPDKVHGYTEKPQIPYIEGEIRDSQDITMAALMDLDDATITLQAANGKTYMWREAWYAAEGTGQTEEANIQFRFESMSAEEIPA